MTVTTDNSRNQYEATAGQTVFAYTFEVNDIQDITVYRNETLLSQSGDYTVSGVGNDSGGNVTLSTGATAGDIITMYRDMALVRLTDYQQSGDFLAEEVNDDFDRLWQAAQQNESATSLAIRAPQTDTVITEQTSLLADVANRKTTVLGFNAQGQIEYYPVQGAGPSVVDPDNIVYPSDFGAQGGLADDTAAMQQAFNSAPIVYIDQNYRGSGLVIPEGCTVHCINGAKIISNGDTDSVTVTVQARTTGHLSVDGDARAVNLILFPEGLGYQQFYQTIRYQNVRMVPSAGLTNNGVTMAGDFVSGGRITGKDMDNNGYPNLSFPQGVLTLGGRYYIESHYLKDGAAGLVPSGRKTGETVFNASGILYCGVNETVNCVDNGCYLLGGYMHIGTNISEGIEESVQVNAVRGCRIDHIIARGRTLGAFNIQNCLGPVNIGEVVGEPAVGVLESDAAFAESVPTAIVYTRSGNVDVGTNQVTVGSVRGYFQLGCSLSVGTVENFSISNVDVTLCYKPSGSPLNAWTVNPTSTSWWNFSGCKTVHRNDIRVRIKNYETTSFPAFTSGNNFATNERVNPVLATVENEAFYMIENDDTETNVNHVRSLAPQQNFYEENAYYRNVSGVTYRCNPGYANYQPNTINGPPVTGYWIQGRILLERSVNADGVLLHKCISTGSPGTWITLGGISEASGTPVSSVTPDYVGQFYRDTDNDDLYMAYGAANTDWQLISEPSGNPGGRVNSDGTALNLPAGWSSSYNVGGVYYTITHNLGDANISATASAESAGFARVNNYTANSFRVSIYNASGTLIQSNFSFNTAPSN